MTTADVVVVESFRSVADCAIRIATMPTNPSALEIMRIPHDDAGYEQVATLRDFVVAGHDELLLRKTRGPWVR